MIVIPRAYAFTSAGAGRQGLDGKGKYGLVGLNAIDLPIVVDGINEKGLVGGVLYFPGYAGYAAADTVDAGTALAPWEVVTWALSNFATVAEIKAAIGDIAVVDTVLTAMNMVPPLHFTFHDETGASLVVEPIDGKLQDPRQPRRGDDQLADVRLAPHQPAGTT